MSSIRLFIGIILYGISIHVLTISQAHANPSKISIETQSFVIDQVLKSEMITQHLSGIYLDETATFGFKRLKNGFSGKVHSIHRNGSGFHFEEKDLNVLLIKMISFLEAHSEIGFQNMTDISNFDFEMSKSFQSLFNAKVTNYLSVSDVITGLTQSELSRFGSRIEDDSAYFYPSRVYFNSVTNAVEIVDQFFDDAPTIVHGTTFAEAVRNYLNSKN